ncbi:MAG: YgjV family protein [Oscillospiraceae bacterium]|nr:YgjV family protein [Oscillospiraceae bacterium]
MDSNIIIGNVCTLAAMGANAASSTRKTAKGMLLLQNLAQAIYFASAIVLKGYSAAVQNAVSILRNFAAVRNIKSKALEWSLTIAGLALGVIFNNRGLIGLLPVIGNLQYTIAIFRFQDRERLLKLSFLISGISFLIFNIAIFNIVGALSDFIVAVTTVVVLLKSKPNQDQ